MGIGNNIKEQRNKLGLTQKDIAEKLNVTAQAVSRWENEEVEPSIDTLKQLSSLFNISLDVFLDNNYVPKEESPVEETSSELSVETEGITEPLGVCARCGKQFPTSQLTTCTSRVGRQTRHEGPFCLNCMDLRRQESQNLRDYEATEHAKKVRFRRILGYVIGLGAFALLFGISIALALNSKEYLWMAVGAVAGVCAYFIIACALLGDNLVTECFTTIAGFGIKFPGIIFTLDIDGIVFVIVMKFIFAILTLIVSCCAFIAGCLISGALAIVYYPYILVISYKHPEDIEFI